MALELKSRAQLAAEGRVYHGNAAAAGFVIPIYSNTTQQFGLWNPQGNDVIAEIFEIGLGSYVDTTGAAGGYVLGIVKGAPGQLATGAKITAFTETTPENSLPAFGVQSKVKFGQGATLTVTAPTLFKHLHISQNAFTAAGTGQMAQKMAVAEFPDRTLWLPPGNAIFLAGNIATLAKYAPTISWGEHRWPLGG
jgi:hypothetical protein